MFPRILAAAFVLTLTSNGTAQDRLPVDPQSGLVMDQYWELVLANCSSCHSARLVTQNRMSAANWVHTIRWMQEKHNLWDLGENEQSIVSYLERNYGIEDLPLRRQPLNQAPLSED